VLEEQELRSLIPQTSSEMQIVEFVRFNEIDPVYLETSYYVVPDDGAERAYALLVEGMRETGYAAIGQVTMHRRDHVVIVRPGKTGILAHTMFYPDEVRSMQEFRTDTNLVAAKELTMAKLLIEALAQPFDPARFKNTFRARLEQLIQSRIEGQQTTRIEPPAATKVIDIMDALKRSLAQAKSVAETVEKPVPRTERKPATAERSQGKTPARSTKAKQR
jgi:DNA end-binding protein Ku